MNETETTSSRVRNLLSKSLFVNFVINFDRLALTSTREGKTSSLLGYKRRLFASPLLYDSDDKQFNNTGSKRTNTNGVAVEYLAAKFKDYVLTKMTKHVIDQSAAVVDASELKGRRTLGEIDRELNDVDRARFEALRSVYTQDLECVWRSQSGTEESRVEQETHRVLVRFLEMLNQWKLGNWDEFRPLSMITDEQAQFGIVVNSKKSLFIQAVVDVLNAYENITAKPETALEYMTKAIESIEGFQARSNPSNIYLVEVIICYLT